MRSGAAVSQLARLLAPDSGEDAFQAIGDNARNYLAINVPPDEPVMTPEQAAEYKRSRSK